MAAATRYVGSRHPVTCVLLLQPRRIVRMHRIVRVCSRIASSAGASFVWPDDVEEMVYVLVRSELIKQRRKRAASSLTRYACTCSAHAAVVPCHKDPVAFARPHAAVATRSRHACVMGCAARRASGLEDIRPVCEAKFRMAAHARCISASRGDVASGANARLAPARAACVLLPLEVHV